MRRLLLAEVDRDLRQLLCAALEGDGTVVVTVANGRDALEHLRRDSGLSAAILDARLPGMSGLEVLRTMRRYGARVPVLLVTSFGDHEVHEHVLRLGRVRVIEKPLEPEDLVAAVREVTCEGHA
jgi:DNA-binding response OmpR family regulator